MLARTRRLLLTTTRLSWLLYGLFLWIFWLASVPSFLQRAAAGTLPTTAVEGLSAAQAASTGAISWGISVADWAWINAAVNGFSFLVFSLVAFLIWWRVHTGFGLLTAYVLLLGGSAFMNMVIYGAALSETAIAAWELGAIIWPLFFLWLYLFPNGRVLPRRPMWFFAPLLSLFSVLHLLNSLTILMNENVPLANAIITLEPMVDIVIPPLFLIVIGAQIYRYVKLSSASERKQTKWFLFGLLIAVVPTTLLALFTRYPAELDTITFTALPIGIGVSVFRYRLWDIDLIIRKTLVYAVLSGLLVLVYLGLVVLLQNVFDSVSGQQSPIAIIISTLTIAALFAPLRRRVQALIDRRFFRQKYDAQQILTRFAQTARDEVAMEALRAELVHAVQETMQPASVSIWLEGHGS